jgi:hypothetical protein
MDGKALTGTRAGEDGRCAMVLSVYDGQTHQVLVQEPVEIKEDEIVAAPKALAQVPLAGKVVTGDALPARATRYFGLRGRPRERLPLAREGK